MTMTQPHSLSGDSSSDIDPHGDLTRPGRIPAWMLSTALHTIVIVVLALVVRFTPASPPGEPNRAVGVVLARSDAGEVEYFDEAQADSESSSSATRNSTATADTPLPTETVLPIDVGGVLPSAEDPIGAGTLGEILPDADGMTQGTNPGKQFGGAAQTSVYGLQGEGSRFLYVFDRSGSMSGYGGRPLRSAQAELIASLNDLDSTHQFQIIFYNEEPNVFRPDNRAPRLVFGDDQGKALAQRFVRGIVAAGGTRHMEPLVMALRMRPDVIFFLTDAEEPKLSADELAQIRRLNKGSQIHAIEFGFGPTTGDDNFLRRLARQNGGQHAYVDISKLPE